MRPALDTNSYTDLCRGKPQVVESLETDQSILLPLIVIAELRAGLAVDSRGSDNGSVLQQFLIQSGVEVLAPDEETTLHYGAVYRRLRSQGTPIPIDDIWIAALVQQHGLALMHRDSHFKHLPQLATVELA